MRVSLLAIVMLLAISAQARVFDMGKERFGSILRTTYLPAVPGDLPFSTSGGNNVSFNDRYTATSSYEFGVIFASGRVNTRLSFEIIQPAEKKGILGSDAAGTQLYTLSNSFSVFMPKLGLEFVLLQRPESRIFFALEAGSGSLTLQNSYAFTPAGSSAYGIG